jgi:hypothetical protein
MASRSLGTLTLDLILKMGGFTSGMDQAARQTDKRMREIERRANAFGKSIGSSLRGVAGQFLAFAGVTLSVGAAVEGLKHSIDIADETRDLSIRLGVSTETLSAFRYAAQQTGTDMDTLAKGMKIFAKNAADALNPKSQQAQIFKALGVDVVDAQGKLKDLGVLLPEVADKFKVLQDGTTKAALAQQLFGKSGLDLTEFLNQGKQGLDAFAEKARELGLIISEDTAAKADDFKDTLGDLRGVLQGVGLQVASELLPTLKDLVRDLVDLVKNGNLASDIASVMGAAFHGAAGILKGYENAVNRVSIAIEGLIGISEGLTEVQKNIQSLGLAGGSVAEGFRKARDAAKEGQAQLDALTKPRGAPAVQFITADSGSLPDSAHRMSASEVAARQHADELQKSLQKAFAGPPDKGRGGKSDAERKAEQVAHAIEQMTKAQQDWEAELNKTGNPIADEYAQRLREIDEQAQQFSKEGVPADKVKAFVDEMTKLAGAMKDEDIAKFQKEFNEQTDEMVARFQGPAAEAMHTYQVEVKKLDDLLKGGTITLDEYNQRIGVLQKERDAPVKSVLQDIQEQTDMLGLNNEQQDTYNKLKQAGVSANSEMGQAIIAANENLHEQARLISDQVQAMDGLRDAAQGFRSDLAHGTSVWDALKSAASRYLDVLLEIMEKRFVEGMLGESGSTGQGTSGGGIANFLGGLFSTWFSSSYSAGASSGSTAPSGISGPRALGGPTFANAFHEVGESDRPEVLFSKGKEWLLPGNQGRVMPLEPAMSMGGGGQFTQNLYFPALNRADNRSKQQVSQRAGESAREAMRRNSGRR